MQKNILTGTVLSLLLSAGSIYPAIAQTSGEPGTGETPTQTTNAQTVTGTIQKINGNSVTIQMADGTTQVITVKPADLQRLSLATGMQIQATLDPSSVATNMTVIQANTTATGTTTNTTGVGTTGTVSTDATTGVGTTGTTSTTDATTGVGTTGTTSTDTTTTTGVTTERSTVQTTTPETTSSETTQSPETTQTTETQITETETQPAQSRPVRALW